MTTAIVSVAMLILGAIIGYRRNAYEVQDLLNEVKYLREDRDDTREKWGECVSDYGDLTREYFQVCEDGRNQRQHHRQLLQALHQLATDPQAAACFAALAEEWEGDYDDLAETARKLALRA